jgi:hypothetical protein
MHGVRVGLQVDDDDCCVVGVVEWYIVIPCSSFSASFAMYFYTPSPGSG